jgi:L-fucose isomerase-like protein
LLGDEGIVASCEGDVLNTVTMVLLNLLSGETVTYGDVVTHYADTVKFSSCGFLPLSMGCGELNACGFSHAGFSGIHAGYVMRPGKVTFARLIEDIGSYHILYGCGQGKETPLRDGDMPALDVELEGDIDDL